MCMDDEPHHRNHRRHLLRATSDSLSLSCARASSLLFPFRPQTGLAPRVFEYLYAQIAKEEAANVSSAISGQEKMLPLRCLCGMLCCMLVSACPSPVRLPFAILTRCSLIVRAIP